MFNKLFGKKNNSETTIYAPVDGEIIPLSEVQDPVFSEKMMGDGVAIKPINKTVVAPIEGKIIQVFETKHAVGIQSSNGVETLIHIGLETVGMNGEGFQSFVDAEDTVEPGDRLISFDMELVKEKAASDIILVIITNTNDMKSIDSVNGKEVRAGQNAILKTEVK
ncbi:PTS glucose transporter subunit IIA [Virgibacillus sp. NKC19-3]|uniref:PTS sugar transporter subunit IIA n=1 Tax=Virgibacillus saliphilus TaxID=2831674 RepID=UPI001C9B9073|nr:PTS glucose transporter subunit IIA [Virgibacillus sp. NKC19-3]MBY7142783.1 PTS glucose transporter subunit IIA [Virgibacillus sp. NKC19-3]